MKGGNGHDPGAGGAYSEVVDKIMPISFRPLSIAAAVAVGLATAGPATASQASCAPGEPRVLVHVAGLKQVRRQLKISLYGSDGDRWLAKKGCISRMKVPVAGRSVNVCMAVPAPGRYALAVHHDVNLNGADDRQDGGGYSRNPKVSLFNPKPSFDKVAFTVGTGPAGVGSDPLYINGLSVSPAEG